MFSKEIYKRIEGRELSLWALRPAGPPRAAVLMLHGGGWERESPAILFRHAEFFAARGYLALLPEYRLMPRGGDLVCCLQDCADAALYARAAAARYGFAGKKLAAFGESAGGYLACCLGSAQIASRVCGAAGPLADAVVDINGIVDLTGRWGYALGGTQARGEEAFCALFRRQAEYSPLYNVRAGDAPVYIWHGLADTVVDPKDSARYAYALRGRGVDAQCRFLPGKEHAFLLYGYGADEEIAALLQEIADRLGP